jgi:hypothetical protein
MIHVRNEADRGATFRIELPLEADGSGQQPIGAGAAEMRHG